MGTIFCNRILLIHIIQQHHVDPTIGVYMIDRYTYYALEFLEKVEPNSKMTMGDFVGIKDFNT